MKIITVNVSVKIIDAIKVLIGEGKLYPSRSELVRMSLRDFFKEEIKVARALKRRDLETIKKKIDDMTKEEYVKVPEKTFKILREA